MSDELDLVALAERVAIVDGVPAVGSRWVFRHLWLNGRRRKYADVKSVEGDAISGVYPATGTAWSSTVGAFLANYVPEDSIPSADELAVDGGGAS